jgi:hypothetical protein
MEAAPIDELIRDIARAEKTTREDLLKDALGALLREKRRALQMDRLEVLRRHGVTSAAALEDKVRAGEIEESPAWEDRIVLETLEAAMARIERDLASL